MTDFAPRDGFSEFNVQEQIDFMNSKLAGLLGLPRAKPLSPPGDSSAPAMPPSLPLVAGAAAVRKGEGGR